MTSTDLGTADGLLRALAKHGLIAGESLGRAEGWRRASPRATAAALADFLVQEQCLTRFQADAFLREEEGSLTLGRYTLEDVLGSGSMGTVYKARSSKDNTMYAVKVVPRRNVINIKSIAEKVEALKQVRHPRVSALIQVGAQGNRAYMAWPLLEGGEKLDAVVKKHGHLSPRQASQIGLQIASGLQAYHEHDLFHGLLKPSDVLIGADRRVRLLDYGVGFLLTCDRGKALLDTMTNTKALARGLDCASPEAIMDPLNRTIYGDQYSLGCILYFCLAGRFPFVESNPVKKMLAHQFEEPEPIRKLVPDCPPLLAAIVHQLLQKQPEDRYETTADLVAALQMASSGQGLRPAYAPAQAVKRGRAESPPADADGPQEAAEPMKKDSDSVALWLTAAGVTAGAAAGLAWFLTRN